MTVADALGRWAASFRLELAPPSVVRAAKRSLIDVVGVALGGGGPGHDQDEPRRSPAP